jgi:phosphoribosylaminoimidazolecarboxamide formyltransferase / IMP cyclohydrolase
MQRRALLSVSDKTGLVPFAATLAELGFELVSTGGTFKVLSDAGIPVKYVTEITGYPEVYGGRVKTLHPVVHGGILHRRDDAAHVAQAADLGVAPIDVVVVNLYPFVQTVRKPGVTFEDAIENIDIGGPAMVRASAKNHASVTIVVSPDDYGRVAAALKEYGGTSAELRRELALKAYRHTATYDSAISTWLASAVGESSELPAEIHRPLVKVEDLRYGENPHQAAALYRGAGEEALNGARVLQGKAISYNNLVDLDAAVALVLEFDEPAAVIIKHTNPCGTGRDAESLLTAYERALAADPVSAFGGIVALNRAVDGALAARMAELFLEVIVAPSFDESARERLGSKTNLRLVEFDAAQLRVRRVERSTLFGTLVQTEDARIGELNEAWNVVTDRAPTAEEETALRFLWRVCKHVKSNAIVIGDALSTIGVGAGQMSRVDSVKLAVGKATRSIEGAVLASDAFFPFRDGLDEAAKAGVKAIIQPGGSRKDAEVIAAANEHGIAMVFTGHRHFRH